MAIYTRKGDEGHTSILRQSGLSKSDPRVVALGILDELNANLGLAKTILDAEQATDLTEAQKKIICISAALAGHRVDGLKPSDTQMLENRIDGMESILPKQTRFLIPGDHTESAQIHVVRTVCRRAESAYIQAWESFPTEVDAEAARFLNRLSDYLYVLARYTDLIYSIHTAVLKELDRFPYSKLDLSIAKKILESVEEQAALIGIHVVVAVVDTHGAPMAVHVMDGSFLVSYDVAISKAFTAVALKMPTEALASHLLPGGMFCGLEHVGKGKITGIGGGLPLTKSGEILGAIGVSGGTAEQDIALARRGAEIFTGVETYVGQ